MFRIQRRQANILEQLAAVDQIGKPAAVAKWLARDGRVINEFLTNILAKKFVGRQFFRDDIPISQFINLPHAMHEHNFLEPLVGFRILDDGEERCKTGARSQQIKMLARQQIMDYQGACGFAAHEDLVADIEMLQTRGQRTVLHLDAEELEILVIIRARDAVRAHEGLSIDLQANHDEVAIFKA